MNDSRVSKDKLSVTVSFVTGNTLAVVLTVTFWVRNTLCKLVTVMLTLVTHVIGVRNS